MEMIIGLGGRHGSRIGHFLCPLSLKVFVVFFNTNLISEIWEDPWLTNTFSKRSTNAQAGREDWEDADPNPSTQVVVVGAHPHKTFEVGDVVAVPAEKPDPFWLAKITEVVEAEGLLKLHYYSSKKPANAGEKRTWPLLALSAKGSTGEVKGVDVLVKFRSDTNIFTKQKKLRRQSYIKIAQACSTFLSIDLNGKYQ